MKSILSIMGVLVSTGASAATYHCHTNVNSGFVERQRDLQVEYVARENSNIEVNGIIGIINKRYQPKSENAGYLQYVNFNTNKFVSTMISPEIQSRSPSGKLKIGILVDSFHGVVSYFPYQCTKLDR